MLAKPEDCSPAVHRFVAVDAFEKHCTALQSMTERMHTGSVPGNKSAIHPHIGFHRLVHTGIILREMLNMVAVTFYFINPSEQNSTFADTFASTQ